MTQPPQTPDGPTAQRAADGTPVGQARQRTAAQSLGSRPALVWPITCLALYGWQLVGIVV